MDIIYVGSVILDQDIDDYSGLSIAGNKMELGIISNIARVEDNVFIVSIPPVAPFPSDRHIYFNSGKLNSKTDNVKYVSFINIPILKQVSQVINTFLSLKRTLEKAKMPIIVSYNMYPQNGLPVLLISRIFDCNFVAIIADPPIDEVENRTLISGTLYKYYNKLTEWCIKKCRNVVVLNKEVVSKYCPDARSIIVEGGVEASSVSDKRVIKNTITDTRNIVYSGKLSEYSGIMVAIEAMEYIESNDIQLHIYGDGPLASRVEKITRLMKNVIFYGKVANIEMIEIQRNAWVLINPRIIDNLISKYTFPSKILEYMLSGKPIITTKLNGIEDEYDNFLVYTDGDSPLDFSRIINSIDKGKYQEYLSSAQKGSDFVLKNKNWQVQSSRIREFLETCY